MLSRDCSYVTETVGGSGESPATKLAAARPASFYYYFLFPGEFSSLRSSPCGGRCISGYMRKDIKPSQLLSKCPAMQLVPTPHFFPLLPRGQTPDGAGNADSTSCKCVSSISHPRLLGGSIRGWWAVGELCPLLLSQAWLLLFPLTFSHGLLPLF